MKKILSAFLALILAFGSPPSFAGYAQLKPPSGWSQGMGAAVPGQAGVFSYGAAANAGSFKGSTVLTNAALNVAGQMVVVPVGMRVAANAAAEAAAYSFGNPWLFAAALAVPVALAWFKESGFELESGMWVRKFRTGGVEYRAAPGPWAATKGAACSARAAFSGSHISGVADGDWCHLYYNGSVVQSDPIESRTLPEQVVVTPVQEQDFINEMKGRPIPDALPLELPNMPIPVQQPVFNPDPAISPQPAPSPLQSPRPMWVPTGDPVKNPNPSPATQPDTWTQPGVKVSPSPTVTDPWRVDVSPDDKTKNDPSPNVDTPVETTTPTPEKLDIETCGLPGKPKCLIDETGTPADKAESFEPAKTELDTAKTTASDAITAAEGIAAPSWSFTFQLPTGCAPYVTGIRGFIMNVCEYQSTIHDLLSMVWAAATAFACIGMVGRTIREA